MGDTLCGEVLKLSMTVRVGGGLRLNKQGVRGKPLEALAMGPKLRCGLALFSPCSSRSVVSG